MPRLGVPANIHCVRALFRQPQGVLNPLGLRFAAALAVRVERVEVGSNRFRALVETGGGGCDVPGQLLRRAALVPLLVAVRDLFGEQVTAWQAFDGTGARQPEIEAEVARQLREYARRHPRIQLLFDLDEAHAAYQAGKRQAAGGR